MADYEVTAPADSGSGITTENAKVRGNWVVTQNTIDIDHFAMANPLSATDGQHRQVTIPEIAVTPTAVADTGILYVEETDSKAELLYMDEDSNAVQLTSKGYPSSFIKAFGVFNVPILGGACTPVGTPLGLSATAAVTGPSDISLTFTISPDLADANFTVLLSAEKIAGFVGNPAYSVNQASRTLNSFAVYVNGSQMYLHVTVLHI